MSDLIKYASADLCPDRERLHTQHPSSYLGHSTWAARMSECHTQHRCPTCGFWAIWQDADGNVVLRAELRPIERDRDEPTGCLCVPRMPMGCDYPYCSGP